MIADGFGDGGGQLIVRANLKGAQGNESKANQCATYQFGVD